MTKVKPPSPRRSSRRISHKDKVSVSKLPKKKLDVFLKSRKKVVNILDFKKQAGKTMYLVERDGPSSDAWETEDMIESLDVLSDYQQKVQNESGYSIDAGSIQQPEGSDHSRPSRLSKTRAVMALKQHDCVLDDYLSDDSDISQKPVTTNNAPKKSANQKQGRKTKAEALADIQHADRLKRQKERLELNPDEIIDNMTHFYGKECCLKCAANTYRDALESNDMKLLETALNDKEIPSPDLEDKPNGLSFVQYAIVLQREVFAEVVEKHDKTDKSSDYPIQFLTYNGGSTGRNHGLGTYHNRSFRRVEESRGNRVGDSAFYRESDSKRTFMNVEDNIRSSKLCSFMHYISKDAFRDEKVIENYLVHFSNGPRDVYYAAAAGSRLLAKSLLQHANVSGRSTFNLLHEEVLQFENGEPLTSYKRNQILKMASDAFNVTPYHLAAINPRATYLSELFEALDPAERMQTDIYGRSVAFFAAVSETSDCLEFLESKGFNFSVVDKYKMSPLMQAARYGRSHNIEILIRNLRGGPEVTETSPFVFQSLVRNRRTALHYAAYFGHAEACSVLIRFNAPVECLENLEKQTPLLYAAKNGNIECVRVIIEEGKANPEKGDKFSRTPLHHACMNGHTEVVKYLLSKGVNANAYDSSHNTPIHFAAAFGYIKIVHLLIEYGFSDPTPSNVWRSTPCSVANMKGHIGVVKYLLGLTHFTIDVNFKDNDGYTMLHRSISESASNPFEMKTNIEKATFLLSMKADTNSINLEGNTSLHTLVSNIDYVKLRPKGWETFYPVPTSYHMYEEVVYDDLEGVAYQETFVKLLIDYGANLNIKNAENETALAIAIRVGNHHLVLFLIQAGAKFWVDTDKNGNNFFHYFGDLVSSINGLQPHYDLDIVIKERFMEVARNIWTSVLSRSTSHMTEIKTMVNERNKKGYTPLIYSVHSAIQKQREAMVREKYLVKSAVFNNSKDNLGYSQHRTTEQIGYTSRLFEKAALPLDVKLTFSFDLWITFMREVIKQFKPSMNDYIELPYDYKKENPKAKKSEYPNLTGYTALHIAAQTQDTDLINFLLENGSNPNLCVKLDTEMLSGDTSFIIAYHHKKDLYQEMPENSAEYHEVVKKFFALTKPDFKDMLYQTIEAFIRFKGCPFITNITGYSVLSKASANMDSYNLSQICNAVSSKNIYANRKNEMQETPLMIAINSLETTINAKEEKPKIEIVKYLLKINADPNIQYENGDTVLMKIIKMANIPLLEILMENSLIPIDNNLKNKRKENALIIACKLNNLKVTLCYLSLLKRSANSCELNTLDCEKNSALSYAAKNGDLQVVEELLLLNADPNFNMAQHVPLIEAVAGQNIDVVKLLLVKGALVNKKDESNGNSALHNAVLAGKHRIVKLLLEYSADFNLTNNRLQSPMHLAVQTTKHQTNRNFRTERLLINAGANVNAVDIFGRSPLHYLFVESGMIPITRETTIVSKTVNQISNQMKIMQDRIQALEDFTCKFDLTEFLDGYNDGDTYLNTWMKEAKMIQLDKSESDKKLKSPITDEEKSLLKVYHGCKWEEQQSVPPRFDPIDMLTFLLDSKDLQNDIRDEFGRTPLHYAACVGAFSCTSLLAKNSVDINAKDSDNNGPLHLALRHNCVDYSVMLCNLGANVNNSIILKDGKSMSTFGFCLSQSFINMAYLIMDKGVNPIESIRESLKTGKFHIAEILLNSLGDECLSSALPMENQNIWHVISDFKPFNDENWEEYVEDIIEKLLPLNIPIIKDIYGRTPIHYAAKQGQITLLRRLLTDSSIQINIVDMDGYSELDYAVNSGLIPSVQALLNSGANVSTTNNQLPSLVLRAVQLKKYEITELLLKYGASTDEDSKYGRMNAVMTACQNKDLQMLNILITHHADLNTPSLVERKDDVGKKYTVLLHPIFAASYPGSSLLEVMLKSNVNPNVYGPESKPEHGMSCFMYNVAIAADANQRILLKYNIDLNVIDLNTSRSIFYQFLFRKIKYDDEFQSASNVNYNNMHFDDVVYRTMLRNFKPEINTVDKITGMTPLEYAINEKNMFTVEQLLTLGANINIESCNKTNNLLFSSALNQSCQKLPAIIHAVTKNNLDLLRTIFKHAQDKVNWMWHDEEKHNALSFIIGGANGFSHENVNILEFIFDQMKPATFKKLLKMKDIYGLSPADYAFQRRNKGLYEAITRLEPTEKNDKEYQDIYDKEYSSSMDVDYISTQTVDQDAAIERRILQKEKDLEKARDKSVSIQGKNDTVQVDPYSNLERVGYVVSDENQQAYDIILIKVELLGWGSYTNTSFYKMSIIHNKILDINILWTRWGSYGDEGQHQKTPYLNLDEAIVEFKSIFKSKTGNAWENRSTSFSQKRDRYGILKISQHPRDVILKNFSFLNSSIPAQLPYEVVNVMKLICNYTYLSRVYSGFNVDMPLGQVSQKTIESARQVLADVQNMQIKLKEAKAQYSNKSKLLEARDWEFKIAQKCLEYARLLPRRDSGNKPVRSLLNNNLKEELSMIEDLSYVGFAANVILAAKHHIDSTNPLQYAYQALNCSLRKIESDAAEHQLIKKYIQSTSNGNYDLVHLLGVNRADEENRFRPFEKEENRMLLWHGSRIGNFMGILKQGLRVCPRTSSLNGAMLGSGIYFADTFMKSLNYSTEDYASHKSSYRLLLLCEVALGPKSVFYNDINQGIETTSYDHVKGEGSNIPDPDNAVYDKNGLCVPVGPCISYTRTVTENNRLVEVPLLNYNEFAVHDENRVKIRYLLIFRESTNCFLCSKSDANLEALYEQDFEDYNYSAFNTFEKEVVKSYLTHQNQSPQDVFDYELNDFIKSELYKQKWETPLDLCRDSKVCHKCAKDIVAIMLEKRLTSNGADIPECLQNKPHCEYGKECRTQSKIAHAKKYQHWFKKNVSGEKKSIQAALSDMEADEDGDDTDENNSEDENDSYMDTDEE